LSTTTNGKINNICWLINLQLALIICLLTDFLLHVF